MSSTKAFREAYNAATTAPSRRRTFSIEKELPGWLAAREEDVVVNAAVTVGCCSELAGQLGLRLVILDHTQSEHDLLVIGASSLTANEGVYSLSGVLDEENGLLLAHAERTYGVLPNSMVHHGIYALSVMATVARGTSRAVQLRAIDSNNDPIIIHTLGFPGPLTTG